MFRTGLENLFLGDAGAVSYLLLVLLVSLAAIGRSAATRRRPLTGPRRSATASASGKTSSRTGFSGP